MFDYKINPDYFGEALTFHLAPPSGENISWSSTLVCESTPAEFVSFPSASDAHMLNQRWVNMILNIMVTLYLLNSMLALLLWAFQHAAKVLSLYLRLDAGDLDAAGCTANWPPRTIKICWLDLTWQWLIASIKYSMYLFLTTDLCADCFMLAGIFLRVVNLRC